MANDQHGLSLREVEFLQNRLCFGKSLAECYRLYKPDTKQNEDLQKRSGWATLHRIQKKLGSWVTAFSVAGVGPDTLAYVLKQALEANKSDEADYTARLRAAKILQEVFGMTAELNVNLTNTGPPLPMIIEHPDGTREIHPVR